MFDHLLESSYRNDSNKWSNIGFGKKNNDVSVDWSLFHASCPDPVAQMIFKVNDLLKVNQLFELALQCNVKPDWSNQTAC